MTQAFRSGGDFKSGTDDPDIKYSVWNVYMRATTRGFILSPLSLGAIVLIYDSCARAEKM